MGRYFCWPPARVSGVPSGSRETRPFRGGFETRPYKIMSFSTRSVLKRLSTSVRRRHVRKRRFSGIAAEPE